MFFHQTRPSCYNSNTNIGLKIMFSSSTEPVANQERVGCLTMVDNTLCENIITALITQALNSL